MTEHHILDSGLLDALSEAARGSPRARKNRNLHATDDAPCHRLFNAIEPGSYVAPHRHLAADKDETIVVVRGRLGVAIYDADGRLADHAVLESGGARFGVDVPRGTFHTFVALASGTVFLEAKAGPYAPLTADERAPWAPSEDSPEAAAFLADLAARFA